MWTLAIAINIVCSLEPMLYCTAVHGLSVCEDRLYKENKQRSQGCIHIAGIFGKDFKVAFI